MRLIRVYILFFLLAIPAIAQAYPLDDTGFLRAAKNRCWPISFSTFDKSTSSLGALDI